MTTRSCSELCVVVVSFSDGSSYRRRKLINSDEHSRNRELSIRYNQLLNMFDRFPLGCAICYTEGFRVRVVNPAFGEAVGVARERLRDSSLLDVLTAVDPAAVEQLTEALLHRQHGRFPLDVHWTAGGHDHSGHLTVELVDEALLGELPLLVFLHVNPIAPQSQRPMTLEPVAARILELAASGITTSVVARQVGLTVDGVNYHLGRLCRRLDVPNRVALVARAYVLGLLDPEAWPPQAADDAR
jgi:DNA-binding CsgD family transcriptional regulator